METKAGFQSTHSLRSATYRMTRSPSRKKFQSTHSLRSATGRRRRNQPDTPCFNPRTPCGVRPIPSTAVSGHTQVSIHALLAECDSTSKSSLTKLPVSIHALLAECDFTLISRSINYDGFQSTHSLRSATLGHRSRFPEFSVSIHALLAECDRLFRAQVSWQACFNPRTPCGVRLSVTRDMVRKITVSIHALLAECDSGSVHR